VESAGPAHSLIEVFEHLRISPLDGIADAAVIGDPAVPINFSYAASIRFGERRPNRQGSERDDCQGRAEGDQTINALRNQRLRMRLLTKVCGCDDVSM
jgi:hypothetical protein